MILEANAAGGPLAGSAADDILVGGAGNDALSGGFGDDFILDGAGRDTLTGGAGADTFIFLADGQTDTVTDFEVGRDMLDFSRLGRIYGTAQFIISETATGARLQYGDELLILNSSTGGPITAHQIEAAIAHASRMPLDMVGTGTSGGGTGGGSCPRHDPSPPSVRSGGPGTFSFGSDGGDRMNGTTGDDTLDGGAGADNYDGRAGIDTVSYASATRRVVVDLQKPAFAVGDTFTDIERFTGSNFNDQLGGDAGANYFSGGGMSDRLYGRAGNDTLIGGAGVDALYGNLGQDRMTGGGDPAQLDRFIYFHYSDSPPCPHERDIITDFVSGVDRIEISRLDADLIIARNQAFTVIGTDALSGRPGESRTETQGGSTVIQADADGDRVADFEIELTTIMTLVATDFLL